MSNKPSIHFDPASHTYTRNGKQYTSCTTVVGQYKKPFNRRFWAMYSALKEVYGYRVRAEEDIGIIHINNQVSTIDELYSVSVYRDAAKGMKNGWDDITKTACDRGNKVHDFLENSINISKGDSGKSNNQIKPFGGLYIVIKNQHDLDKTNLLETYPEIYSTLLYYISNGCSIYAEKKIFIDEYEIAGMIDCLVVKGNKFMIIDWKTNKDIIHFTAGYYKKEKVGNKYVKTDRWIKKPQYLLYPLNYLEDCKGILYGLQVSLYAYMMESWGYELIDNGLMIYHMRPNENPKRIPIRYMKEDIITMLNHYKETD